VASCLIAFVVLAMVAPRVAVAATITIVNNDGPDEGFNDGNVATPVGGNPGTTIGAQRLFVFQTAANIWGALLQSSVEIQVLAQFNPQTCTATSGVLGSAAPTALDRNFPGAIFTNTWYHEALASKLAGVDLSASADINATFNSNVGMANCLSVGWYYGIDGNEGDQIELLPVVLHELGHGLGFSTQTNGQTGAYFMSFPHVFDRFLYNPATGLHWNQMTAAQRAASALTCTNLVWDGPLVTSRATAYLGPKPVLHVNAPAPAVGDYEVGQADFGPPLNETGLTGDVVLANDGVGVTSNACEPLINVVAGKIVLLDRGGCTFTVKVKNAQNAGAIGVVVADSAAGCPPAGMGGSDPTITIPSVRITQANGNTLKANLTGQNVTMIVDLTKRAGTHSSGRIMMFAPNPYQSGSSVSHWDTATEPNLLMEPAINNSLSTDPDLTIQLFGDIGWFGATGVATEQAAGGGFQLALSQSAPNPGAGYLSVRYAIPARGRVTLRVFDVSGRLVATPVDGMMDAGPHAAEIRTAGLAAGVYFYRLESAGNSLSRRLVVLE
jgi:hypothetical protein